MKKTGNGTVRISGPHASYAWQMLLTAHNIEEHASVVVPEVRQIVGEVREVIADADLQVLPDIAIDRGQRAAALLTDIGQAEHSRFNHALPALAETPVG